MGNFMHHYPVNAHLAWECNRNHVVLTYGEGPAVSCSVEYSEFLFAGYDIPRDWVFLLHPSVLQNTPEVFLQFFHVAELHLGPSEDFPFGCIQPAALTITWAGHQRALQKRRNVINPSWLEHHFLGQRQKIKNQKYLFIMLTLSVQAAGAETNFNWKKFSSKIFSREVVSYARA